MLCKLNWGDPKSAQHGKWDGSIRPPADSAWPRVALCWLVFQYCFLREEMMTSPPAPRPSRSFPPPEMARQRVTFLKQAGNPRLTSSQVTSSISTSTQHSSDDHEHHHHHSSSLIDLLLASSHQCQSLLPLSESINDRAGEPQHSLFKIIHL